jgi:hypothetical protein
MPDKITETGRFDIGAIAGAFSGIRGDGAGASL